MNWYVLFVQTLYEDKLCAFLNRSEGIHAFSAKLEYYRRDRKTNELKSLFPGYVFVKTEFDQLEFNEWLRKQEVKKGFIKQLQYDHVSALQKEEIQILTVLLNDNHVLPMSYGHLENNKIVIDCGTLKGLESYIVKYDKRNRLASLDLFFLNQRWVAGVSLERKE